MELLDQLPCAVLVTDTLGQVLAVNADLVAMVGGTASSWVGVSMDALLPPASRIFLQTHIWPTVLREGRVVEIHLQVKDATGQRLPVLLNCRKGKYQQGQACYWTLFLARERHRFEAELVGARNRAEQSALALDDNQRFIKRITDAMPDLVAYWGRDLRCKFANAAYLTWFGRRQDEMIGMSMRDLLGDRLIALNEPHIRGVLAGEEQHFERSLAKADGSQAHTLAHYLPDRVGGDVVGFFATVSDVTQLKQAEAALRAEMIQREQAHRQLLNSTLALEEAQRLGQVGSWHWLTDGDVVWWSAQLYAILGCKPDQPAPSLVEQAALYEAESYARMHQAAMRALQMGAPYALELAYTRPDGQRGWVDARGEVVRGEDGRIVGLRGTVHEITAIKRQHDAVTRAQQRLRALYETTPAMLHSIDASGRLLAVSDTWLAKLGYSRDEVIGRASADFLTPASRERAVQTVLPAFFAEGRCDEVAYQLVTRDGQVIDVLMSAILERGTDEGATRSLAVMQDVSLRRRAEGALEQERQRLANIIEGTQAGTWEWNVRTGEVIVNRLWAEIIGWTPEELGTLTNQFRVDISHPDEIGHTRKLLRDHFAGRSDAYLAEVRLRRRDGEWIWVEDRGRIITRTASGQPEWMFGIHIDITKRRKLEQQVQNSERLLRQVFDNVPALIAHIDVDRRYTMVNRAYVAWDRRTGQELLGSPFRQVHGEEGFALLAPHLEQAFSGQPVSFEVELPRGDNVRAMQVAYVPNFDDQGEVVGVFAMKVDITRLRRAEQKLRVVMEASPLGMFVSDAAGRCQFTNAAWQRISGMTLEQSLGHGWAKAIHPEDRERLAAEWRMGVESGTPAISEHRYQRPDGTVVWVRGHAAPIVEGNYAAGVVGTVEDISEQRLLNLHLAHKTAELRRSNEDLERFAYVASHDLQEPLRMVTSYGQLLMRRHEADLKPEAQEFLHFMVDGGQRAQALIRDLLSLARIDSQALPWQAVDLQSVLDDTLQQLRMRIQETGATVTHDALPTVMVDVRQIRQLMINLVSNALKFRGPQAPEIHVGALREGTGWRVNVRDNGIGIEPRFFDRIFAMFQRLHLRSEHEGTGIGLAICKRVVERHGGHIGVESQPGQGSTFYFTLPDHMAGSHLSEDAAHAA